MDKITGQETVPQFMHKVKEILNNIGGGDSKLYKHTIGINYVATDLIDDPNTYTFWLGMSFFSHVPYQIPYDEFIGLIFHGEYNECGEGLESDSYNEYFYVSSIATDGSLIFAINGSVPINYGELIVPTSAIHYTIKEI